MIKNAAKLLLIHAFILTALTVNAEINPQKLLGITKYFRVEEYSPTLGAVALHDGLAHNLRMYWGIKRGEGTDPLSKILKILFPSDSGYLTTRSPFGVDDPRTVAWLLNFAFECRNNQACSENIVLDNFKHQVKSPIIIELLSNIKLSIMYESASTYPKYTTEQMINAFFVKHFNTREDILVLLNNLDNRIVYSIKLASRVAIVDDELKGDGVGKDEVLLADAIALWQNLIPYRSYVQPVESSYAQHYDRSNNEFIAGQIFEDVNGTSLRHLNQILLYNSDEKKFDLSFIKSNVSLAHQQSSYFKNYEEFFADLNFHNVNSEDLAIGSRWSRVIDDLNDGGDEISYDSQYQNNQLECSIFNYLKVFHRIFGWELKLPASNLSLEKKKLWLEDTLQNLFTKINPTKTYSFDLRWVKHLENEHGKETNEIGTGGDDTDNDELDGNIVVTITARGKTPFSFTLYTRYGGNSQVGLSQRQILDRPHGDLVLFHQLFKNYLVNTEARLELIEKIADLNINVNNIDYDMYKILLDNILQDIAWQNSIVKGRALASLMLLGSTPFADVANKYIAKLGDINHIYLKNSKLNKISLDGQRYDLQRIENIEFIQTKLKIVELSNLANIIYLDLSPATSLKQLVVSDLARIKTIKLPDAKVRSLELNNLAQLDSIINLSKKEPLERLVLSNLAAFDFKKIFGGYYWQPLKNVKILELTNLANLKVLELPEAKSLELLVLSNMPDLTKLNIIEARSLEKVDLNGLTALQTINIDKSSVGSLELNNMPNLQSLYFTNSSLKHLALDGKAMNLEALQVISLEGSSINSLELSNIPNLKSLNLGNISSLEHLVLDGKAMNLEALQVISLEDSAIESLELSNLGNLQYVKLSNMKKLEHMVLDGKAADENLLKQIRDINKSKLDLHAIMVEHTGSKEMLTTPPVKNLYWFMTAIPECILLSSKANANLGQFSSEIASIGKTRLMSRLGYLDVPVEIYALDSSLTAVTPIQISYDPSEVVDPSSCVCQ